MRPIASTVARAAAAMLWAQLVLACVTGGPGSPCSSDSSCGEMGRCLATEAPVRTVCMTLCASGTRLCGDGATCLEREGLFVCWLGGGRALGDPCTRDLECEPGTTCPAWIGACVQACTVGDDRPCYDDEVCEGPSTLEGVCRPRPAADAGTDTGA